MGVGAISRRAAKDRGVGLSAGALAAMRGHFGFNARERADVDLLNVLYVPVAAGLGLRRILRASGD
jgi:hypothetical protein